MVKAGHTNSNVEGGTPSPPPAGDFASMINSMEAESRAQSNNDSVPLPKLGPGETFTMDMQMMPPGENGMFSAKMTPMKIMADGSKVVLDPKNPDHFHSL
mmetsp:Transcript_22108/g.28604  ORF Transcript_22108/g.28604 Transcript_22108/m.28604 type:complete len:100 (+) Transcript_22108:192-491(+)